MAPSCFALHVPDARGFQVAEGTTVLVSLERSCFHACPHDGLMVKTGRSGSCIQPCLAIVQCCMETSYNI